jgi:hypothetical protein
MLPLEDNVDDCGWGEGTVKIKMGKQHDTIGLAFGCKQLNIKKLQEKMWGFLN